jgi:uncharacterized protein (DUF1778 family)
VSKNRKAKKVGRPALAKEHRHAHVLQVRVKDDDLRLFSKAAKAKRQTLSEWIRANLRDAVQE